MKRLSIAILMLAAVLISGSECFASVSLSPRPIDLYDLDHSKAYYWGVSYALKPCEVVTNAWINIKWINDWKIESNDILYVDLFQDAAYGIRVKAFRDNEAPGDYFNGWGTQLFTYEDTNEYRRIIWNRRHTQWRWGSWVNPPENISYYFTADQLEELNNAMADGKFAFGFDPDCHYYNCGIQFNFETARTPEPASLAMLGLGLAGFVIRKKRTGAKR